MLMKNEKTFGILSIGKVNDKRIERILNIKIQIFLVILIVFDWKFLIVISAIEFNDELIEDCDAAKTPIKAIEVIPIGKKCHI